MGGWDPELAEDFPLNAIQLTLYLKVAEEQLFDVHEEKRSLFLPVAAAPRALSEVRHIVGIERAQFQARLRQVARFARVFDSLLSNAKVDTTGLFSVLCEDQADQFILVNRSDQFEFENRAIRLLHLLENLLSLVFYMECQPLELLDWDFAHIDQLWIVLDAFKIALVAELDELVVVEQIQGIGNVPLHALERMSCLIHHALQANRAELAALGEHLLAFRQSAALALALSDGRLVFILETDRVHLKRECSNFFLPELHVFTVELHQ